MIDRLSALFAPRPKTAEAWLARMGRPRVSPRDQAQFLQWLEADPDNLDRYEEARALSASLEPLRGAFQTDLAQVRWRPRRRVLDRRLVLSGALTASAVVGALLLAPHLTSSAGQLYEGAPGRITDIRLDDGSRVTLDAGSAIRVKLGDDVRRVTLERGAAYFDVAHDAALPFQVHVLDRNVIVTGTRFVTTLEPGGGQVSLLEGRVVVSARDAGEAKALSEGLPLAPGQRASFTRGAATLRDTADDLEVATAWRKRRLIFQDTPLSEVIAAASRYSDRPMTVADPRLGALRVTAILPLDGDGTLVERIDNLLPVRVETGAEGQAVLHAE